MHTPCHFFAGSACVCSVCKGEGGKIEGLVHGVSLRLCTASGLKCGSGHLCRVADNTV